MEISHADHAPFAINTMFDRVIHPPRGRNDGHNGTAGRLRLASGTELRGKGRQPIPAGDRLIIEMPGGGGLGDPRQRDPKILARDVRDAFVSPHQAHEVYGWTDASAGGDD